MLTSTRYGMPSLRALSATKFRKAIKLNGGHPSLAQVISEVYTSTDSSVRELRECVASHLKAHKSLLRIKEVKAAVEGIDDSALGRFKEYNFKRLFTLATRTKPGQYE